MRIDYSKISADIQKENLSRIENDKNLFNQQQKTLKFLKSCDDRKACVLCNSEINGEIFIHREITMIQCKTCGHVQTKILPPPDYPFYLSAESIDFKQIYPKLNITEYNDRKNRIYKPKFDWIISCLNDIGYSNQLLQNFKWTEIGCGAGSFLSCLQDFGVHEFLGFDINDTLIENANEFLKKRNAVRFIGKIEEGIKKYDADVYVAFFVLEHISELYGFLQELKNKKQGTVFVFSVPTFGFTNLTEEIHSQNYARSLDCVVHTQIFTDESIEYAIQVSGFSMKAQWIFGQDADDLIRIYINHIKENFSSKLQNILLAKLFKLNDTFQTCIDALNFSDQKHILAIKE